MKKFPIIKNQKVEFWKGSSLERQYLDVQIDGDGRGRCKFNGVEFRVWEKDGIWYGGMR